MITPEAASQKWAQSMGAAGAAYKAGVMAVTQSPMQLAAQNQQGYINGVMAAVNTGKWQAGLNRVSLSAWQNAAANLGSQRLGAGATNAQPKVLSFMQSFWPTLQSAQNQVKQMPADTYEARKARSTTMMDLLHAFKRTG
jgi:hypothetical protein